jgi:hypothetical protein
MKKFFENIDIVVTFAFILGLVVGIVFLPFAGIWALNTLFGTGIPYTFQTWLASLVLLGITRMSVAFRS